MDGSRFDHLTRLAAQSTTRRAAFGLAAALGLAGRAATAGQQGKNLCKGGCQPCQVCKKKRRKKVCVTAPDGATCAGGTCQAGSCITAPATCAPTCPDTCTGCLRRPNGSTVCTSTFTAPCETSCGTDADCPAEAPVCGAVVVGRTAPVTIDLPAFCEVATPGSCVLAIAC